MQDSATALDPEPGTFAAHLLEKGLLQVAQIQQIEKLAKLREVSFYRQLIDGDYIPSEQVIAQAGEYFQIPILEMRRLESIEPPRDALAVDLIRKHQVIPLQRSGKDLLLAVSDPSNAEALREITFISGLQIEPVLLATKDFQILYDRQLHLKQPRARPSRLTDFMEHSSLAAVLERAHQMLQDNEQRQQVQMEPLVDRILLDAIQKRSSDIHLEPFYDGYRIRYRIDGMLYEICQMSVPVAERMIARIKIMARLDTSERRVPQDGRVRFVSEHRQPVDFRISTMPTVSREKLVLRILDAYRALMGIEQIGFLPSQLTDYVNALNASDGIILVTGPTGSGKTVSLYAGLNLINTVEKNVSTVEDPVEIILPGVNHVHVNEKVDLSFAVVVRGFLRQDPDVIGIGEIRDAETADIAIKAAQSGHLVLSTLHCNDAISALSRLTNFGVDLLSLATSLRLLIAQRLLRTLCPDCKVRDATAVDVLQRVGFTAEQIANKNLYKAVGCANCQHGYLGRIGIHEVIPISKTLEQSILHGHDLRQIEKQARDEGAISLRAAGVEKVATGISSLQELQRVLGRFDLPDQTLV